MRVVTHPEAAEELEAASLWYEKREAGLGDDFLSEFENTLLRMTASPERWRKIRGENRQIKFRRFPYAIVHGVKGETIFIKAVMHLHRRPFYWKSRTE